LEGELLTREHEESADYFSVELPAQRPRVAGLVKDAPCGGSRHQLPQGQPRRLLKRPLEVTQQPLSSELKGTLVSLGGHLEESRAQWLEQLFVTLLKNGCEHCIVDLMRLKGINRAGVECIGRIVAHFQRYGASLFFAAAPSTVCASLMPVGLCKTIPYYATIERALEQLDNPAPVGDTLSRPVELALPIATLPTDAAPEANLEKHIKAILADFGPVATGKMVRLLRTQGYGGHSLSLFSLLSLLNRLDLNTRSKQERFHRSW
jgi:anti-anti-sigma regulatory factor